MNSVEIKIDKTKIIGRIKPMHCINNVPAFYNDDCYRALREAGIPFCRMHDTFVYTGADKMVDIPKIFPDFDADEDDEASYDFAMTDALFAEMAKYDLKPFYRLGTSIENYRCVKPYYIFVPGNFLKWAKICEHVIRHYNEGWNNGFYYNITHWEIWNEPDNFKEIKDNQLWLGTKEQFFDLYQTAASYLKSRFPLLKFGGYASCGFYAIFNEKSAEQANVSSRTDYFIEFFKEFLSYIKDENHPAPLDFFSWHSYSGVEKNIKYAEFCRKTLDEYGFTDTEHYLNEWNPGILNRGLLLDASSVAANMLALQDTSLDMLMYYDGKISSVYCGIFNPLYAPLPVEKGKKLLKTYYVFKAFNELYKLGKEIKTNYVQKPIYAVSAFNGQNGAILLTNNSDNKIRIAVTGIDNYKDAYFISEKEDFTKRAIDLKNIELNGYEILLIGF